MFKSVFARAALLATAVLGLVLMLPQTSEAQRFGVGGWRSGVWIGPGGPGGHGRYGGFGYSPYRYGWGYPGYYGYNYGYYSRPYYGYNYGYNSPYYYSYNPATAYYYSTPQY